MKEEERKPHVHAEFIHAFAEGYKIEKKNPTAYFAVGKLDPIIPEWQIDNNPDWDEDSEYRIYDPLREVKEAFKNGKEIQKKIMGYWIDSTSGFLEEITDGQEWRVKPKEYVTVKSKTKDDYVPFEWEDREIVMHKWVRAEHTEGEFLITGFSRHSSYGFVFHFADTICLAQEAFDKYTFLDGSPFGKLKKK